MNTAPTPEQEHMAQARSIIERVAQLREIDEYPFNLSVPDMLDGQQIIDDAIVWLVEEDNNNEPS